MNNWAKSVSDDTKLLTIITVVFNSNKFIKETISSIIGRKNRQIEYLIVDGGSTDGTLEIIKDHSPEIDFFISEPDLGIYDAMNKAIRYASGRWIIFINSGDIWLHCEDVPELMEMLNNERYNIILGNSRVSNESKQAMYIKYPRFPLRKSSFIFGIPVCHQAIFYLRSQMIPFNTSYTVIADKVHLWELFSRAEGKDFALFNYVVSEYRLGGFSEKNRTRYQQEEAKFFSEVYSLGLFGKLVAYWYLYFKRKLFLFLTHLSVKS